MGTTVIATTRKCRDCPEPIPLEQIRCQKCRLRRSRRDHQRRLGNDPEVQLPAHCDPAPARALRDELAQRRGAGQDFATAWPPAVRCALEAIDNAERRSWADCFWSTKPQWRSAFEGIGPELLTGLVDVDAEPGVRGGWELLG